MVFKLYVIFGEIQSKVRKPRFLDGKQHLVLLIVIGIYIHSSNRVKMLALNSIINVSATSV